MIWSKICQSWQAEWWILFDILFSVLHGRERWTSLPGNISQFWTFGDFLSFVAATVLMVWRNVTSTSGATSHGCHQFSRRASQCKKKFLWYSISIFLYIWYFWGNTFGNISFFLPGSVGCASAGWKTTALALPHTHAIWIAQTHAHQPAPVCGHLQDAGEGISESVTLNWDSSSQLPSNTKWLWMTWKSKFQNFQREYCSVSPMWCSYENGRDCTETHRTWDVPRAEGTACKAIIHYI